MSLSLLTPNQKMLTPNEESVLIQEWIQTRSEKSLVRLLRAFSPLVAKFVRRYAAYGIAHEELFSVGNLALIETAHRFQPDRGLKFSTYSSHWIKGTMLVFIASNYFAFTLKSQKIKHIFFKLRRLIHEQKDENDPGDVQAMMDTLAVHFGVSATKLEQIYDLIRHPMVSISVGEPSGYNQDDRTFGEVIPTSEPDPEASLIDKKLDAFRKTMLYTTMEEVLNSREREIICGQMLSEPDQIKTLQDLAKTFNLSRERIRQIRNHAIDKLQAAIQTKCKGIEKQAIF